MKDNERIRTRRLKLGLSETSVASSVGMGIHAYCDLEQHADEFRSAVDLRTAREICRVLGLTLEEFLDIPTRLGVEPKSVCSPLPRGERIARARESVGLTRFDIADRLGFDESAIEVLESDSCAIDRYPIEFLLDLTKLLGMPPGALLRE
jgi:transcriptional regulator with XRE-family HTH domain